MSLSGLTNRLICAGLVLMLWGCGGNEPTPPSWYGKPSADKATLVGFGSGKNLESAKANALSDIITQLNVEVSSQFNLDTQRKNQLITHKSSNSVSLDSSDIQLNQVQYSKSEFDEGTYFIKAEVAKSTLVAQFQKQLNNEYNELNITKLMQCESLSIKDKSRVEKNIDSMRLYATLLRSLGTEAKSFANLETLLTRNSPLPSARLVVETSNIPSEFMTSDLAKELGHFYTLESDATQVLKAQVRLDTNRDGTAKLNVIFSILDCHHNPIFNTNVSHNISGHLDNQSLRFASSRVSVQLYKKIQEWIEQE